MIDPRKTAVLVLDVQNDFCADDGAFKKELGSENCASSQNSVA
ncbi:MAG: hypothetical protein AAB798_00185 [Patescibacteria group bacterium]